MTKPKTPLKLLAFDAARYLDDDEAIAEYMTAVLEANDPDLLLLALGDVARAKGMAQVAKDAGLGRESLYKALCGAGPVSTREAARRVGRDVKAVHADATALLLAGLLDRTADGQIEFPYDAVKVEFLLQAA